MWEPSNGYDGGSIEETKMIDMFATSSDIISLFKVQHEDEGNVSLI